MSDKLINLTPCSCDEHNDSTEIRIQLLWRGFKTDVAIIYCHKCNEVESVNVPHPAFSTEEFSQIMYKAWNQRKSNTAEQQLLDALKACRGQWIHSVNAEQCLEAIKQVEGL